MSQFKVGDEVSFKCDCCDTTGSGIITGTSPVFDWILKATTTLPCRSTGFDEEELSQIRTSNGGVMGNLVKRAKDLVMSGDDRVLRKQGFVLETGELSIDGKEVLLDKLFADNKEAMVAIAKKLEAEDKLSRK